MPLDFANAVIAAIYGNGNQTIDPLDRREVVRHLLDDEVVSPASDGTVIGWLNRIRHLRRVHS